MQKFFRICGGILTGRASNSGVLHSTLSKRRLRSGVFRDDLPGAVVERVHGAEVRADALHHAQQELAHADPEPAPQGRELGCARRRQGLLQ